jgi:hypothetical protein
MTTQCAFTVNNFTRPASMFILVPTNTRVTRKYNNAGCYRRDRYKKNQKPNLPCCRGNRKLGYSTHTDDHHPGVDGSHRL